MAMGAVGRFNAILRQSISLALWRRPRSPVVLVAFGSFLLACALSLALYALQDRHNADPGALFYADGLHAHANYFLCVLVASWLASWVMKRPALWLTLASMVALIGIGWSALAGQVPIWLANATDAQLDAWQILIGLGVVMAWFRAATHLARDTGIGRRSMAVFVLASVLAGPWYWRQDAWLWLLPDEPDEAPAVETPVAVAAAPKFDPEALLYRQPQLLRQQIATLQAQTPGRVDLYSLGFAGDGSEAVFRNEVAYFSELMASRFGGRGRNLALVNSPDTVASVPLATLSNLRSALAGIAGKMDRDEDLLFLYLTSHGSDDHRLYVGLDPLSLDQITPQDLRAALDDAGIRWRVVVVSACYSGGFVDALRDPRTLVITSARGDRASFGCGADSDITWFGKAFLAQALNQTTDVSQAFAIASRQVREWELAQGQTPSVPQFDEGPAIERKLQPWRSGLAPAPALAFHPTAWAEAR